MITLDALAGQHEHDLVYDLSEPLDAQRGAEHIELDVSAEDIENIASVVEDGAVTCVEDPSDFSHEPSEYAEAAEYWRGLVDG